MKILVSKPHAPPAAFLPFLHAFLSWLCFGLLAVGRAELASGFWGLLCPWLCLSSPSFVEFS